MKSLFCYPLCTCRYFLLTAVLFCFSSFTRSDTDKFNFLLHETGKLIQSSHYQPVSMDDAFSDKVFHMFLKKLDPDNTIFLQQDIASLQRFRYQLDDEISGKPIAFFYAVNLCYLQRLSVIYQTLPGLIKRPFNFNTQDSIRTESASYAYPKHQKDQQSAWKKKLKYLALEKYVDLMDDAGSHRPGGTGITDSVLAEEEARRFALTVFQKNTERLLHRVSEEERFSQYLNTITHLVDPHSDFFLPVEKRAWNEDMTGKFYGIGAFIDTKNGEILIGPVASGGSAWKSGEIQEGDVVLKIGQGDQEPVDIAGYDISDAVQLIRGEQGTIVRLTVKKPEGVIKTVALERAELKMEETFCRSAVIRDQGKRIGYIYLPKFYSSMGAAEGRNCHADIAQELFALRDQDVDGIIIDLRNNGGGSLYEAIKMAGLFIPSGPMVQVRSGNGRSEFYEDNDGGRIVYDGPLEVMVNEFSASASEIFAAAIQDYGRGIITGSSTTFGKGTVQRPFTLPAIIGEESAGPASIHLTVQQYYRVNGASTQLRGVVPDIILPGLYEFYPIKEKNNTSSLSWDAISSLPFTRWHSPPNIPLIRNLFLDRNDSTGLFARILDCSKAIFQERDKPHYLSIDRYRSSRERTESLFRDFRELTHLREDMDISPVKSGTDLLTQRWIGHLKKDMYLCQATLIIATMIRSTEGDAG